MNIIPNHFMKKHVMYFICIIVIVTPFNYLIDLSSIILKYLHNKETILSSNSFNLWVRYVFLMVICSYKRKVVKNAYQIKHTKLIFNYVDKLITR